MDGPESSSESEMEVDDESEEEMNTKVSFFFFKWAYKYNRMSGLKLPAALQTPQKKEKQVTAKKTPEKKEEDEYAGSTDVDEPGLHQALFNVTELYLTFLPASVFRLNFL